MVTRKSQYDMEYHKQHIKRYTFDMQKEWYENVLIPASKEANESISTFIKTAILERIERMHKDRPE